MWALKRMTVDVDELYQGQASVAFAIADGSIGTLKIFQALQLRTADSELGEEYSIEFSFEIAPHMLLDADNRATTGLAWVSAPNRDVSRLLLCIIYSQTLSANFSHL